MKPAPFVRHVPRTLDEAVRILAEVAPQDGRVLAGGQSLVPIMAFRLAKPAHLVDINEIEGLDKIASDGQFLSIGARVRHAAFHKTVVENPLGALLSYVARHIAHYPIRMRGTFCGSLAHADPASEWCLTAATLDAMIVAKSTRGTRSIAAKDFFAGIMSTALAEDELLAEVRLPLLADDTCAGRRCSHGRLVARVDLPDDRPPPPPHLRHAQGLGPDEFVRCRRSPPHRRDGSDEGRPSLAAERRAAL